ncbi:ParB/RepB/Spo0J family partition protein [Leucobacter sp. NPDC058333]|uniref:ParB/RepB/Spo0J family partition protein n=1 Tax=Leucobacter sp. NPDC058333 TaxID=3346450 RepID=UPI003659B957
MTNTLLPENVTIRSTELDVDTIIVRQRQREVDADHVELLRRSIAETGKQIVPIAVSERAGGRLVLIDGAHRLEAAKQDGRTTIRAEVYTGLDENQEDVLEFVTNRARRDLSPLEILAAWETFDLPLYELKTKEKQLSGLRQGNESPVIPAGNNGRHEASVSISEVAKAKTGHKPEWLDQIRTIRDLSVDEKIEPAVREVAQRAVEKLRDSKAKVGPVFKEVQKISAAVQRQAEDPEALQLRDAEDRLDEIVRHTTLLQEKLDGNLRDFLLLAGRRGQMGRDMLRATRVALVRSLTSVVVIECEVSENASESLQTIGREVTTLLFQESTKALSLRQAESEAADV